VRLEISPKDVGNRPNEADFVLESLWLTHGATLVTVTDKVHLITEMEPSEREIVLVHLMDREFIALYSRAIEFIPARSSKASIIIRAPNPFAQTGLELLGRWYEP
jgi:hypothetical protein